MPHGVWVPFGAARSNEHRHTRARKFRHDPSETHPQEQRGEGFTQRESWGGRLDVDKTVAPPQSFPAMRPAAALFAQALRARGSAGRAHDETPLRDFRGVLFFRRAKMHGDNPARVIGRVRQRGSRCYPANRARSITGPKEPRASVDSAWRCGAPAAVSISLRAASSRSGPEKGLPGLLSENHRPHVVVRTF